MKGFNKLTFAATAALLLSACGGSSDDNDTGAVVPPQITSVRVHHAVADAPNVNVLANGTAVLEDVPYGASSGVLNVDAGDYTIQVDGILPGDSTATVIGPADVTWANATRYEVFAIGSVGEGTIEPLIFANIETEVAAGNARLQVVHASPDAPMVDVYLTAVDTNLAEEAPAATLQFGDFTSQVEVPAGEYQVRMTLAGDPDTVAFTSPALDLAEGADLVVAAINNTQTGDSPVMLQIADGQGSALVNDVNSGADVRIVHASADAPAVDFINDAGDTRSLLANLEFGQFSNFLNVPAGDYAVDVTLPGDGAVVRNDIPLTTETGVTYSVYALGALADDSLAAAVITEDQRRIATEAKIQLIHASPTAGEVDIYVTASDDISAATPAFTAVPFSTESVVSTGYVSLTPGDYVVTITPTGSKDAAIGPLAVTLDASGVYTAVAVDNAGGGAPLGVIVMDDFAVNE